MVVPLTGWPDLVVEIAPGDTPLTVSPTWVDVTDTIDWDLVCTRGRTGTSDRASAGTMQVTWDDPEREFDSANTASPHAPYIRPRLPIRFRATYSAVDYPLWRGHLTTPEHSYAPEGDDTSRFDCVDLFAVMATVDTSQRSAWASTIEGLAPLGWWRFGEENPVDGEQITDDIGNYHGTWHGTSTSVDSLVDDEQSGAVNFGTDGYGIIDPNVLVTGQTEHTLVFRFTATTTVDDRLLVTLLPGYGYIGFDEMILGITGSATSYFIPGDHLFFLSNEDVGGTGYFLVSDNPVTDGEEHTVALTLEDDIRHLYLDGVLQASMLADAGPSTFAYTTFAGFDGLFIGQQDISGQAHADNVTMDELVLLPGVLDASTVLDLHEAAVDSWAGETTGDRIGRAADLAGIPAGLQDIAAGVSTVAGWSGGRSTIDVAQEANDTEQGTLVVSADGKLTFEDRHEHINDTIAAVFGDTGSDLTYCGHATEQGEHLIVNRATFTSPAGTGFAEDPTSIAVYGIHSTRRTTIDDDRNNLIAGAQYLVARSSGPEQRIVGLDIDPTYDPTNLWPQVLGRDVGDKITVNRTPAYGDPISQDLVIVGVRHTITPDSWRTRWALAAADSATFAISDVSTSDGPAFAAY